MRCVGRWPVIRHLVPLLLLASPVMASQSVVVLLDDSGSMQELMPAGGQRMPRIEVAKTALAEVLKQIPSDAQVGILTLNHAGQQGHWLVPLGPIQIDRLSGAIRSLRAAGGTPLGEFMKVAADDLLELRERQRYGHYRLLIVTDGEANDPELLEGYLPQILARGITIDVIGVDMQDDHSLATRVHSYRRAGDLASLTQALAEALAETVDEGQVAGESDFALLAGLPDELAAACVLALSTIDNRPLASPDEQAQHAGGRVVWATPPPPPARAPGLSVGAPLLVIAFVVLIAVGILWKIVHATQR